MQFEAEKGFEEEGFAPATIVADSAAALPTVPGEPDSTPYDGLEQKLVYSADLSVESLEFDAAVEAVVRLTGQCGGFVQSSGIEGSTVYAEDGVSRVLVNRWATYELRIPSASFDSFLAQSGEIGNIISTSTSVDDISTQYYDAQSRLDAYEVQYDRLLALLERAELMEDIILLEERLNEVRYNIESLTTKLRGWQNQVNYSTVHLSIREVSRYTPQAQQGFLTRLGSSATRSLGSFVDWIQDLIIALVYALPYLLVLALVALPVARLLKKRGATITRKRDKSPQTDQPQPWEQGDTEQ